MCTQVTYQGTELDFGSPFRRVSMSDLVQEACGVDVMAYEQVPGGEEGLAAAKAAAAAALKEKVGGAARYCAVLQRVPL